MIEGDAPQFRGSSYSLTDLLARSILMHGALNERCYPHFWDNFPGLAGIVHTHSDFLDIPTDDEVC